MALDESLLDSVRTNAAPPTLRLYLWKRPAITLGRFQNISRTMNAEACRLQGVPLVRRITGGRGILHGDDLTVTIAAPIEALGFGDKASVSVIAIYERLSEGFLRAFAGMGTPATLGACLPERVPEVRGNCFATISRADVVEARSGVKLLGSALHRRERWILQQASIPLLTPARRKTFLAFERTLFRGPSAAGEESGIVGWEPEALCEAIVTGFAETLGITLSISVPEWQEQQCAEALARTRCLPEEESELRS